MLGRVLCRRLWMFHYQTQRNTAQKQDAADEPGETVAAGCVKNPAGQQWPADAPDGTYPHADSYKRANVGAAIVVSQNSSTQNDDSTIANAK